MFGLKKKQDVRAEINRRKSQTARILDLLQKGGDITNIDLQRIAFNYSQMIKRLC